MKTFKISDRKFTIYIFVALVLLFVVNDCYGATNNPKPFIIEVAYKEARPKDTLVLLIGSKYLQSFDQRIMKRIEKVADKNGLFTFNVPVDENFGYWQLYIKNLGELGSRGIRGLTRPFFWEAGDSIKLKLSNIEKFAGIYSTYLFSGVGSEKYACRLGVDSLKKIPISQAEKNDPDRLYLVPAKETIRRVFRYIDAHNSNMSPLSISVLKTEQIYNGGRAPASYFSDNIKKLITDKYGKDSLIAKCNYIFSSRGLMHTDSTAIASNLNSLSFLIYGLETESTISLGHVNPGWIYQEVKLRYRGVLRDELLAYLLSYTRNDKQADSLYKDALSVVKSNYAKKQLISIGAQYSQKEFSGYKLYDKEGKVFELAKLKGKVIVFDFWFTGCGPCSTFYTTVLSKVEEHYKHDDRVVFVSVNIDVQKEKWLQSLDTGNYSGNGAVNLWTGGSGFQVPLLKENNVQSCPTVILVDSAHRIRYNNTEQLFRFDPLISSVEKAK